MIPRYGVLIERFKAELESLEQVVQHAENALKRANFQPHDQDFYITAAAFDLHSFYTGIERLFEAVANEVDQSHPKGTHWHRDLLLQMTLSIPEVRPAVLTQEAYLALLEYLEFRHLVRNVYTFHLRSERVAELVGNLRPTFDLIRKDLLIFMNFLDSLSRADQEG